MSSQQVALRELRSPCDQEGVGRQTAASHTAKQKGYFNPAVAASLPNNVYNS